ncbi:hypothetical protein F4819DRAFT_492948 [Hypoxylon fuscum]|nr:hypothetical protein F4819DRAFT_492948 [Hypoxylon fuscum]
MKLPLAIRAWVDEVKITSKGDESAELLPSPKRFKARHHYHQWDRQPLGIVNTNAISTPNTMPPQPGKKTTVTATIEKSPVRRTSPRRKRITTEEEREEVDNEATPQLTRPSWAGALRAGAATDISLTRLELRRPTSSLPDSSHSSPSKRSRSPAKTTTDLQFANIELRAFSEHPPPDCAHIQELLSDIQAATAGISVVPHAVQAEIASNPKKTILDRLSPHNINVSYHLSDAKAVEELHQLRSIIADAADCKVECQSEAAWNARVHDPLLRLSMETAALPRVRPFIATTATIIPALLPRNAFTGDPLSSRLVDFCIALESDTAHKETIKQLLASQPAALRSLNQTMYSPLRFRPIAIAVETKTDTATETGESQLAIWTKAWLNRMKLLGAKNIPPLPVLRIKGHDWFLLLAWEEHEQEHEHGQEQDQEQDRDRDREQQDAEPSLIILAEMPIGDTRSILPLYRLINVLRRLARWADGPFRDWHESTVASTCHNQ